MVLLRFHVVNISFKDLTSAFAHDSRGFVEDILEVEIVYTMFRCLECNI